MADLHRIVGELRELQGLAPIEGWRRSLAEEAAAGACPVDELSELLSEAGANARVYFDRGNDCTNPCTFCGTRPTPTHKLVRLGTYGNGEPIRRPVCSQCIPTAEAKATPRPAAAPSATRARVIEMLRQQAEALTDAAALLATEETNHV